MEKDLIKGVVIKKLVVRSDERGRLMEILRQDDKIFRKFGQCYFTSAFAGKVKAWHCHRFQDDHFTCIKGVMRLALYDSRKASPTFKKINEFTLSLDNPLLVRIPRNVFHGFKALGNQEAIVINVPTRAYNHRRPDELRLPAEEPSINYDWSKE